MDKQIKAFEELAAYVVKGMSLVVDANTLNNLKKSIEANRVRLREYERLLKEVTDIAVEHPEDILIIECIRELLSD